MTHDYITNSLKLRDVLMKHKTDKRLNIHNDEAIRIWNSNAEKALLTAIGLALSRKLIPNHKTDNNQPDRTV